MLRDLAHMEGKTLDLAVVGGGVVGASLAWDAAQRGLRVALVEMDDFASATSAMSLKVIHGGFRYLQDMDFPRMRSSIRERAAMMRMAPHLVTPLPCLMPTSGLKTSLPAMAVALTINDLIAHDRNQGLDKAHTIPRGHIMPRMAVRQAAAYMPPAGCTGGAVWWDGLVHDPERLVWAMAASAQAAGALVANHTMAGPPRETPDGVVLPLTDRLDGGKTQLKARAVALCTGPWLRDRENPGPAGPGLASAYNLVAPRRLAQRALAVKSLTPRTVDPVCGGGRYMFAVPWQGGSILGTAYHVHPGRPVGFTAAPGHLLALLNEFNLALPGLGLTPDEITTFHAGLVPLEPGGPGLAHRPRLAWTQPGVLLVEGIKFTTARGLAQRAADMVVAKLAKGQAASRSHLTPLAGSPAMGQKVERPTQAHPELWRRLAKHYGLWARGVWDLMQQEPGLARPLSAETSITGAEVAWAARQEMALTLADAVLRRTGLGKQARPDEAALDAAAGIMAREMGWNETRTESEKDAVRQRYAPLEALA